MDHARRHPLIEAVAVGAVLAAVAGLYARAVAGAPLDWDDEVWLADPARQSPGLAFTTAHDGVYAPLLRLVWGALGDRPALLHLYVLGAFLAACAGVYVVLRRLDVPAAPAAAALALWALHPTKVECVAWLTGVKDVQSLVLLVAMALVLIPAGRTPPSWAAILLGTTFGAGALLTKAAVFPIPAAVALAAVARRGPAAVRPFAPVLALGVALAAVGAGLWRTEAWPAELSRVALPAWVHGMWWTHLLWPRAPEAIVALPRGPVDRLVPIGIGLAASATLAVAAWRWPRHAGPALGVWLLPQIPFLGLAVPMAFWASDRHLLVPSLGVAVGVVLLLGRVVPPRAVAVGAGLVAVGFATISARRVPEWRDSRTLWEVEVTRPGEHWARWHKVGVARGRAGDFVAAEQALRRARDGNPADGATLAHWAVAALAADGWTGADGAVVGRIEPPPRTIAGWRAAVDGLRAAGAADVADAVEARIDAVAAGQR